MLTLAYTFPTWLIGILIALFFVASVLMILTVLIQRPMGGGLSGAFGSGAGSGQTAFGAKTGDALTIATIIMFVVFLVGAVVLNYALDVDDPVDPASETADGPGATGATPESGEPTPDPTPEPVEAPAPDGGSTTAPEGTPESPSNPAGTTPEGSPGDPPADPPSGGSGGGG